MDVPICRAILDASQRSDPATNGVPNLPCNRIGIPPAVGVVSVIPLCPDGIHTNTESKFPDDVGKGILLPSRSHVDDSCRPRERLPLSVAFGKDIIPNSPRCWASKEEMIMSIHLDAAEETNGIGDSGNTVLSGQSMPDC